MHDACCDVVAPDGSFDVEAVVATVAVEVVDGAAVVAVAVAVAVAAAAAAVVAYSESSISVGCLDSRDSIEQIHYSLERLAGPRIHSVSQCPVAAAKALFPRSSACLVWSFVGPKLVDSRPPSSATKTFGSPSCSPAEWVAEAATRQADGQAFSSD